MRAAFPLLIILFISELHSADDSKLWFAVEHTEGIGNGFELEFEQETRFKREIEVMYQYLFNVALAYEINDYFSIKTGYRARAYHFDEFHNEILIKGYFEYDISNDLEFNTRLRYGKEFIKEDPNEEYLRPRFGFDYDLLKDMKPYIQAEALYRFNYDRASRFDEMRYTIGFEVEILNNIELDLYYMIQDEINQKNNKSENVFGIGFSVD